MESVGYDLYIRLLNEAILEEKGIAQEKKTESVIDISVDAYLPESYVRSGAQRIDLYKKIGSVETDADRDDILDEMEDRYGKLPKAAENLVRVAYLRALASRCHISRVEIKQDTALIYPERFSLPAWSETALRLSEQAQAAAEEAKKKSASAATAVSSGNKTGNTAAKSASLPSAGKYTPFAHAAALARAGAAGSTATSGGKTAGASPASSGYAHLTVSAGAKPCIQARLPRTKTSLAAVTEVLSLYETVSGGKE